MLEIGKKKLIFNNRRCCLLPGSAPDQKIFVVFLDTTEKKSRQNRVFMIYADKIVFDKNGIGHSIHYID